VVVLACLQRLRTATCEKLRIGRMESGDALTRLYLDAPVPLTRLLPVPLPAGLTAATDRMGSNLDSGLTSMSVFVDSHDGIQGAASALGSALGSGAYHMTSDGMSSVASMDMAKGRSLMRSMSNRIPSSGMSYTSKALSSIPVRRRS
jgi:hypothetical protein